MIVGLALVFEGQATVRDMVEVLQPLEERDGDTTSIDVQIGDDQNVAINEYFVSGRCGGSVGGLSDDLAYNRKESIVSFVVYRSLFATVTHLGLDSAGILAVDHLLDGCGNEDVALLEHEVLSLVGLGIGVADNGAVLVLVILQQLGVNALWVVQSAVVLNDTDAGGTSASQIAGGVQTHITEALHNEGLAAPAGSGAWSRKKSQLGTRQFE